MIAIVLIHMVQVFLFGAYKFPRELTWIVASCCSSSRWAWRSPARCCDSIRTPTGTWHRRIDPRAVCRCGPWVVDLMLGGRSSPARRCRDSSPCTSSHSRTAHRVRRRPRLAVLEARRQRMADAGARRSTCDRTSRSTTRSRTATACRSCHNAVWKDIFFSCAILPRHWRVRRRARAFGPSGPPDPTIIHTAPRPDFLFPLLYAFCLFCLRLRNADPADRSAGCDRALLALPFLAGEGEKSWRRRPIAC